MTRSSLFAVPRRSLELLADPVVRKLAARPQVGLEKETLRVAASGGVADTPHPRQLGSALTHPHITTDFSEALLELVSPPLSDPSAVLDFLRDLHLFVYRHVDDERLWATSMPCVLRGVPRGVLRECDEGNIDRGVGIGAQVPLARYGKSNAARMKTAYRRGLGNRYGRIMQIIAGVHFNYSLPEAFWPLWDDGAAPGGGDRTGPGPTPASASASDALRNNAYMGMVRNLQRLGWLVPYLFGASPAVCKSFVQAAPTDLVAFDEHTFYYPYATSLRMGDIGYQNRVEEGMGMKASYDSLDAYIRSLTWAIETTCPHYEAIGVKVNGRYEQLNDHVLQIENEYYSTVRPKQVTDWMERPTLALRRRGIRYVELRSLDVNAFHPLGIDLAQMRFLACFMLYAMLLPSPRITAQERDWIDNNQLVTAHRGREPGLRLARHGGNVALRDWAAEILAEMAPVAELLDAGLTDLTAQAAGVAATAPQPAGPHVAALRNQQAKVADPEATPSARMLAEMRAQGEGFAAFARRLTDQHRDDFRSQALAPEREAWLRRLADESHARQQAIEAADELDFDAFLARYFAQSEDRPVELVAPL